jgi:hypothetical protein
MALTFRCPHCKIRLAVWFKNPIDGGPPHEEKRADGTMWPLWQRTGETFEDLTLSPSVDASAQGHWHGFITKGIIT